MLVLKHHWLVLYVCGRLLDLSKCLMDGTRIWNKIKISSHNITLYLFRGLLIFWAEIFVLVYLYVDPIEKANILQLHQPKWHQDFFRQAFFEIFSCIIKERHELWLNINISIFFIMTLNIIGTICTTTMRQKFWKS